MKIIKEVKPPEQKGTEITCPKCGSELEYLPQDIIKLTANTDSLKNIYNLKDGTYISCPVCNNKIAVKL